MTQTAGNRFWIGVDLAKASFDAAIAQEGLVPRDWRTLPVASFDHSRRSMHAFAVWVERTAGPLSQCAGLLVEATGAVTRRFAAALEATALPAPCVVNPARSAAFARSLGARDKTDRVDAAVLAVHGAVHRPQPAPARSPALARVRDLDRLREGLVTEMTQCTNRLGEALDPLARRVLRATGRHLERQIAKLDEAMDHILEGDERLASHARLVRSVPGLGAALTHTLLAELGDLSAWSRAQIVAFAGLFPRQRRSGTSVRSRPRLAKGGGQRLRRVLYLAAINQRGHAGPLREYTERLLAADPERPKMLVVGALMRKMLLVARAVVVSGQPYDPARVGAPPRTPQIPLV